MAENGIKKLLLSAFVVLTFIAYSFQQRGENPVSLVAPSRPSANNQPAQTQTQAQTTQPTSGQSSSPVTYKDGTFTGSVADAYYGNIQVRAIIKGGKIVDVQFLQYPNDRSDSIAINQQAMPYLKQEAIQAQSANVNNVSGASDTSYAFVQSLTAALAKAQQ